MPCRYVPRNSPRASLVSYSCWICCNTCLDENLKINRMLFRTVTFPSDLNTSLNVSCISPLPLYNRRRRRQSGCRNLVRSGIRLKVVINHRTSLSIRPSWGARGEEIFRWGWGEGEKRKEGFSSLPFSLSSFPFPPETPDTQATIEQAKTTPPPPLARFFLSWKICLFSFKNVSKCLSSRA